MAHLIITLLAHHLFVTRIIRPSTPHAFIRFISFISFISFIALVLRRHPHHSILRHAHTGCLLKLAAPPIWHMLSGAEIR